MLEKIFPKWHASWERKKQLKLTALDFYNIIANQSREPFFFTEFDVPDTFEGRLEMISIHLFLILHAIKPYDDTNQTLSQAITNTTFLMLDEGLRHYGYSDLSLGRRLKKVGERVYARLTYLEDALGKGESDLETLLAETLYHDKDPTLAKKMKDYILSQLDYLRSLPQKDLLTAKIKFRSPHSKPNLSFTGDADGFNWVNDKTSV